MRLELTIEEIIRLLQRATQETAYMVSWSFGLSVIFGLILGLFLFVTASPYFYRQRVLNKVSDVLINVTRSVPFLILLVTVLPLGKFFVGTTIGPKAVIFPLTLASTAFYGRLAENAFSEVDKGVIEAAVASGAKPLRIITGIVFPEALPQLIRHMTVTIISLIGYSSMAGIVGGGGIGDLSIRYGYQRYNIEVLLVCIVILVILVQILQWIGDAIANRFVRK